MRDRRFVAEHRGGPLGMGQHRQLIEWACRCVENVLPLLGKEPDERLTNALLTAREWACGKASVGDARKAAVKAIASANESTDPVTVAICRAAGHAVATAHMADHSLGGALYALKALKHAGKPVEHARKWQNEQLTPEIRELVLSARVVKEKAFRLL